MRTWGASVAVRLLILGQGWRINSPVLGERIGPDVGPADEAANQGTDAAENDDRRQLSNNPGMLAPVRSDRSPNIRSRVNWEAWKTSSS